MKITVIVTSFCVFALLMSSISHGQTPATGTSEFRACDGGWNEWKNDLQRVEKDLEKWANAHEEDLKSPEVGDKREGRMIRLFAAHLLPKGSPFASMHKICWVQYSEFEKAIGEKNKAEAEENIRSWENCARGNNPQLPKEAENLLACWKKNSLK